MYYGARYYDPVIGRFTSVDPVVADSGRKEFVQAFLNPQLHNAYSYVGNNPLKYVDPTGNDEEKKQDDDWLTKLLTNPKFQKGVKKAEAISKFALDIPTFGGASRAEEISQKIEREGLTTKNLALVYSNTLISSAAGALSALDAGVGLGAMVSPLLSRTEVYCRAMSERDFATLQRTGKLPPSARGETFISKEQAVSSGFKGVVVEFEARAGTEQALVDVGVRDVSLGIAKVYGTQMPFVSSRWDTNSAFFKIENGNINIGLGRGRALDIFNDNILGFKKVNR